MEIPGYGGLEEVHRSHRCLVVRARRIADGRAVVLKAVTPGPGNEKAIQTLRQEHRMLVSLAGVAGVVQALALEENAGLPLLVLDDAGPIRLGDRLDRKPMELGAFLPLALRLAETVAVLHARGVVHRDVNPSNVVLDATGEQPTLVDFGTATTFAGVSPDVDALAGSSAGTLAGTLAYMAPEQTGRMGRVVDHRADLYALGATYYQMLTGAPPFTSAGSGGAGACPPGAPAGSSDGGRSPSAGGAVGSGVEAAGQDAGGALPERRGAGGGSAAGAGGLAIGRAPGKLRAGSGRSGAGHGRAAARPASSELGELRAAFERAAAGDSRLVLIDGPAGIGKSALVFCFGRGLTSARPLAWGKFEQFPGDVPYPALVEAFRRLARGWLDGPESERAAWRAPLLRALGRNAAVMTELIPELRSLLGELPAPAPLGPVEAERRFQLTLQRVRAGAGRALAPAVPVRRRSAVGRSCVAEAAGPAGHGPRHPPPAADRRLPQRGGRPADIR